ncbi:hypothetical protein JZ751_024344 [Albula glossodonta]|uniref:Uncharacterized protein n=1 Tax=Albula glossodonta TaxID=121402 RepID=A0A8T2NG25_9TELE|nr:hypothetical protein JZ751_024344 [Albula glossodonta]
MASPVNDKGDQWHHGSNTCTDYSLDHRHHSPPSSSYNRRDKRHHPPPSSSNDRGDKRNHPPPSSSNNRRDKRHHPPPSSSNNRRDKRHHPPPSSSNNRRDKRHYPPPSSSNNRRDKRHHPPPSSSNNRRDKRHHPPPSSSNNRGGKRHHPPSSPPPTTATTAPSPTPVPQPAIGTYSIPNDVNSTACLLATMGLQISYKKDAVVKSINLDPNNTAATGKCGVNGSDASLTLAFDKSSITFTFSEPFAPCDPGVTFSSANTSLSLWEASVGSSYMCRRDQTYNITEVLFLHTLGLQVQPFGVQNNSYATAEECLLDSDLTFLVPIAVGVALAFLIILVLISYLIGRRKSRTGYQSV